MSDLAGRPFSSILIVKLSSIGDVIMATPVARGLRELYPDARIDWIVEPLSADVLAGNPFLNEVIVWDRPRGKKAGALALLSAIRSLRRRIHGRYDLVLDLQGLIRTGLVGLAAGAPVRAGKADAREGAVFTYTHRLPVREETTRASEEYVQVLSALGLREPPTALDVFPDDGNRERADALLAPLAQTGNGFVSITPATTRPYKHWNNEAWARTLDLLHSALGLEGVIHGSPRDEAMAAEIVTLCRCSRPLVIAGRTRLRDAAEVIRRSRLVVGVDTGLMHFGIAMRRPTIAVFGPTTSDRLRGEEGVVVLQKGGQRSSRKRPRRKEWWNDRSIDANTPDDVLAAARRLLEREVPS
jgi:heptosyltransferase-1